MRTCLKCLNLDNCRLKAQILNPLIKTCNYAQEGCFKYKGKGLMGTGKDKVLQALQSNTIVTMREISNLTGLPIDGKEDKQIIYNAINRLVKEGYTIGKKGNRQKRCYWMISDL